MADVNVKLLKPLDGMPIGTETSYPAADAKRLAAKGAVKVIASKAAKKPANKQAPDAQNKGAGQ